MAREKDVMEGFYNTLKSHPFFKKPLNQRLITGCFLACLVSLLMFLFQETGIALVTIALAAGMAFEWVYITKITLKRPSIILLILLFSISILLSFQGFFYLGLGLLFLVSSLLVFLGWLTWRHGFFWLSAGVLYIGIPWNMLMYMVCVFNDVYFLILWAVGILSFNDMGGYFVGKKIGGLKLCPTISPQKTWSGFFGGLGFSLIFALFVESFLPLGVSKATYLLVSIGVAFFGAIGDLVESLIKRLHGVKDSGQWLPGHGGLLDRFDSYLIAIPFIFGLLMWFVPDFWLE